MIVIPFVAGDEDLAEAVVDATMVEALIKEEGTSLALLFGGAIFLIKKGTLQLRECACPDAQAFRDMQAKNQANKRQISLIQRQSLMTKSMMLTIMDIPI